MYHSQVQNNNHGPSSFISPGHSYSGQGYIHRNPGTSSSDIFHTSAYATTKPYRSFSSELNSPDLPLPEEIDMDFEFPVISSIEETSFDSVSNFDSQTFTYNTTNNTTYSNANNLNGSSSNLDNSATLMYPKLEISDEDSLQSCSAPYSNGYSRSSNLHDKSFRNKDSTFHYGSHSATASPHTMLHTDKYSSASSLGPQSQMEYQQRPSSYPQFAASGSSKHEHNDNLLLRNGTSRTPTSQNQAPGKFTNSYNILSFLDNDDVKDISHDIYIQGQLSQATDQSTPDTKLWPPQEPEFGSPVYNQASGTNSMPQDPTTRTFGTPSSLVDFVMTDEDFFTDLGVPNNIHDDNNNEGSGDEGLGLENVTQLLRSNSRKRTSNGFGKRALERIIHPDTESTEPQTEFITNAVISSAMEHILKNRPSLSCFPTAREIFDSSYKKLKAVMIKESSENRGDDITAVDSKERDIDVSTNKQGTEANTSVQVSNHSTPSPSTTSTSNTVGPETPLANDLTSQTPPANENSNQQVVSSSSKPDKRRPSVLPPCRVCSSKASGLHYGVVTCEACNGFFRRSLKRGAIYLCSKDKRCEVKGKKRGECSYCRYQRCLTVGMSKSAVKTGRYSDKTRLAYAIETENQSKASEVIEDMSHLDLMTSDLVRSHDQYVINSTRVPDFELFQRQFRYYKVYSSEAALVNSHTRVMSLFKDILPDLPKPSPEDSDEAGLSRVIAGFLENWLRHYVKFVKNIPGFNLLHINDQATLVRATWHEIWLLGSYKGFNSEMQVTANPNGTVLHYNEIKMIFGKVYANLSYRLSSRLQKLNITPEETVLIKMMCMTYPDRHRLEQPEQVRSLHWLMTQCLMREIEKNHTDEPNAFSEIVAVLVELRAVLHEAMLPSNGYKYKHPLDQDTPLLKEIMAYTPS